MSTSDQHDSSLAQQTRQRFAVHLARALPDIVGACGQRLTDLLGQTASVQQTQLHRTSWTAFQQHQALFLRQSRHALRCLLEPRPVPAEKPPVSRLELVADGAMDDEIIASHLAMRVVDLCGPDLQALRLRIQHLERRQALQRGDLLRPDVVARLLVEQWRKTQLQQPAWELVHDTVATRLSDHLLEAYRGANAFLIASGVMPEIDMQALIRRSPDQRGARPSPMSSVPPLPLRASPVNDPEALVWPDSSVATVSPFDAGAQPGSNTPPGRARGRARGLLMRLKQLLNDSVGDDLAMLHPVVLSAPLQAALAQHPAPAASHETGVQQPPQTPQTQLHQASHDLRSRTAALKRAVGNPVEKATIEVVALMFQSILAEERIPPSVRLWFARLQMPVLRVALSEPGFFGVLQHPARRLIDRMGSCVMGFESHAGMAALEAEIRRIVELVEQYPDTGRRVFELVLEEFQAFLSAYLSEQGSASRYVSVAQQVEQKEMRVVQFTIELRKQLDGITVCDEVRDFLFRVWVDVLAVASVRYGLQHTETQALRQVAADLLWMASAKPERSDRSRVIQQLPALLQRLRRGMDLLGLAPALQDGHVQRVSSSLAQAFMARTQPVPQERLDQLVQRLASLEEVLPEDGSGDLALDQLSIEMITGVDARHMVVISPAGTPPSPVSPALRAWALGLQLGDWLGLHHNGQLAHVQLAWRSQSGQLCLFGSDSGLCYLMPLRGVAAHLQSGLLVPSENEALTVRATRHALAELEADPQRLLG